MYVTMIPTVIGVLSPTIDVLMMKFIIDGVAEQIPLINIFLIIVFVGVLAIISSVIDSYFSNVYYPKMDEHLKRKMQLLIIDKMKEYEISFFDNPSYYNQIILATNEAKDRPTWVWMTVCSLFKNLLTIGTLATIMALIDPLIMLFSIVAVGIDVLLKTLLTKLRYNYQMERQPIDRKKSYIERVFSMPQYAKEMRFTGISDLFKSIYEKSSAHILGVIKEKGNKINLIDNIGWIISVVFTSLIMAYLAYSIYIGKLTIGSFSVMLTATLSLRSMLSNVIKTIPEFSQHSMYIENFKKFMTYVPTINESIEGVEINQFKHCIQLDDVSFEYEEGNKVIDHISLKIKRGEKIAIVGHNGAGKTTLVKLLLRFYDSSSGSISMDDYNYQSLSVKDLRKKFGVIFQDYQYYSLTLAENVLMRECTSDSDRELVIESLKKSGLYDKIESLPQGINTLLTKEFDNHGLVLSTGETQKLALARVFARDSDIVILDEPSSALDPLAEYEMHQNMLNAQVDKTVIIISHRLSTTIFADTICFIENGKIVEKGNHQELMKQNGKYAHMFHVQASSYIDSRNMSI